MGQHLSNYLQTQMADQNSSTKNRLNYSLPGSFPDDEGSHDGSGPGPSRAANHAWDEGNVQKWIKDLRTKYLIKTLDGTPGCPFGNVMGLFGEFTVTLISDLRARKLHAVKAADMGALDKLYSKLPDCHDFKVLHEFIRDGMMKHPRRRKSGQQLLITVMESKGCMKAKLESILPVYEKYMQDIQDPSHILQDPDELWIFTTGLRTVWPGDKGWPALEDICEVCTEEYGCFTLWRTNGLKRPKLCPCGHTFCTGCLDQWRRSSNGNGFTCPKCRKCLVFGEPDCFFHLIPHKEKASPKPLEHVMNIIRPHRRAEWLFGLTPQKWWYLREQTRSKRVNLHLIEDVFSDDDLDRRGVEYQRLEEEYDNIWTELRADIVRIGV